MKTNNLFSDKQFGFINGRSTVLQLLYVLDKWTEILDQGGCIDAVYCDFMKAFDKVPHRRLIHKIQSYGVKDPVLSWITSFLTARTQQVVINGVSSQAREVTSGIPQGSALVPILFVMYINDLPDVVDSNTHIFLFADDTKVFRHVTNEHECSILQSDITKMYQWSNRWLLKFHPQKCVSMRIGKQNNPDLNTYYMADQNLEYSSCEKDIGVFIDNKLKFDTHITSKVNKANSILGIVRKTFDYMDEQIFSLTFKGLVRPHLEYANQIWAPHLKKHIDMIENVQRRGTKTIPGFKDLSYEERLKKLNLPTLAYRRIRGDMIEAFKILNTDCGYDNSLPPFLPTRTSHTRGHKYKLYHRSSNLNIRKYSFSLRITKMWNDLPDSVVSAQSVKSFERRLDRYWKDQPIKYDYKADFIYQSQTTLNDESDQSDSDIEGTLKD